MFVRVRRIYYLLKFRVAICINTSVSEVEVRSKLYLYVNNEYTFLFVNKISAEDILGILNGAATELKANISHG